jgi:hypothetical protein
MWPSSISLATTLLSLSTYSFAQSSSNHVYTVWSSVIFNRIGERTPDVLGYLPTQLTTLGAQQSYRAGAFFANRYFSASSSGDGTSNTPLYGLDANMPDVKELYALALDTQASTGSAQAFLQGLYPPTTVNKSDAAQLDPIGILANGSYVCFPGR